MLDKKYNAEEKEQKWLEYWENEKIYKFDKDKKSPIYSIDTPPPTVSGNIHIGHVFSYSQTEMLARYKRLRGYNVFYPFGFDDNGLPTERLVEKELNKKAHQIGREEFNKHCIEITNKYEKDFENLFKRLGFSVDWNLKYKTISDDTMKISQRSFLDLVKKDKAYHKKSPALWCTECRTSIAQAELETKTLESTFNYINFKTTDGDMFTIATTRPELLPAIVAVFVNPDDEKNKRLIGKTAVIPLLDIEVEILADEAVEKDKGTGIVMCCTFGDQQDILWWEKYNLPLKNIIQENGVINEDVKHIGGMHIKKARPHIIELLKEEGSLIKEEKISHEVQTHERCGNPIDYTVIPQWFIDVTTDKDKFLEIGDEIKWHPEYMKTRYVNWVENVAWDWCISRQRYFGIPFPVWYCKDCGEKIFANEEDLPVNPLVDLPKSNCPKCGGKEFVPDRDVMDTWATSAVTPLINMKYGEKENFEKELKPMSLRSNASDIIRTWDFYTIVKNHYHLNEKPWEDIMITGFVMAGKGEKISKSKGNAKNTPEELLKNYSADILRYIAGVGRLGTDVVTAEDTFDRGKKLINKIFNVSKFMEIHLQDFDEKQEKYKEISLENNFKDFEYIDKWIISKFIKMKEQYIKYFEEFEVGLALNILEKFFWNFCDDYVEIVKHRLYRPEEFGEKNRFYGQLTIRYLLKELLQLFSPFFPYVTEEIYFSIFEKEFNETKSIHLTKLDTNFKPFDKDALKNGEELVKILGEARGEKTNNGVSLKTEIEIIEIDLNKDIKEAFEKSEKDLVATLFINNLILNEKDIEGYVIKEIKLNIEKNN